MNKVDLGLYPQIKIALRLGDPHHNPVREDRKGTTLRVRAAMELINNFATPTQTTYYWDEDCYLVSPIRDLEGFKKLATEEEDGAFWYESELIGHYQLSATIVGIEIYTRERCKPLEELSAADIILEVLNGLCPH